ncbi:branched-chain amino acid ABC transporter permease [Microtetraspora malaysiensis]|uniref:branched-chain amino acid ABC transporter permease n=1 Tax=Microtetraspora malaysiensis TaxID=161358 RepID=UPI003D8A4C21
MQQLVNGIANGCIYGALALALVLIYRCTQFVNFAQGEMATMSTYLVWSLTTLGLGIWPAFLIAVVASMAVGALLYRLVFKRFGVDDHLALVIVAIGLFFIFNGLTQFLFGADGQAMPAMFPTSVIDLAGVRVPAAVLGVLGVLAAVSVALWAMFKHTRVGLGFRAVASNQDSSSLSGLPVRRLLGAGWALAAGLGTLAGCLLTALGVFLNPNMMVSVLVYAFAAATLGGLDSPAGAVTGGLLLGVLESLAAAYVPVIGSDLKLAVAFVVLVLVMLIRPTGLFGRQVVVRV